LAESNDNLDDSHIDQPDDFFRNINIQFLIHELKGPVDVIETNNRMLLENESSFGTLTTSQVRILKRSVRNTNRLRDMLHSLLEVGTSQSGRVDLQQFQIVPFTREVIKDALVTMTSENLDPREFETNPEACLAAHGIELTFPSDLQGAGMYQDKIKYSHILGNLLRNALQHKKTLIRVFLSLKDDSLLAEVIDDGPGIGPEEQENLFMQYVGKEAGEALRRKGHGLGLASSRILARFLGGDISLAPNDEGAAHFALMLPLKFGEDDRRHVDVHVVDHEISR